MDTNLQASSVPLESPDCQHVLFPRKDLGFDLSGNLYLPKKRTKPPAARKSSIS